MSRPDPNKEAIVPEFKKGWPTMSGRIQAELDAIKNPRPKDPFGDI
jgi:hypothetical protein